MTNVQAQASPQSIRAADWALLIVLGAIWGGSFFFARIAVAEIGPLTLALLRVSIAALALQIYLKSTGLAFLPIMLTRPGRFLLLGLLNNAIPFSLIFAGQTVLGAGVASILNATTPFWTIGIAAWVVRSERLAAHRVAGVVLGIAGTALMVGADLSATLAAPLWPKLALVGAAISYAAALFLARGFHDTPPAAIAAGQLLASTLIMLPVALLAEPPSAILSISPPVWAAILALALVSTAFAYLLYFRILASAGATNASLVTLIVPVSALLLGAIFLGETLQTFEIFGMAAIGAGLAAIDGRLLRREGRTP